MTTGNPMQIGMVGLGRMGAGLVGRLMRDGHNCVVYDVNPDAISALEKQGATGSTSMGDFLVNWPPSWGGSWPPPAPARLISSAGRRGP